mmetsp:Transcript_19072/g.48947  ORF Transcript_19072/g.48947 Transcript_19072/m.48947 type:complete len:214 (-) Transcript_19072:25-666(-)
MLWTPQPPDAELLHKVIQQHRPCAGRVVVAHVPKYTSGEIKHLPPRVLGYGLHPRLPYKSQPTLKQSEPPIKDNLPQRQRPFDRNIPFTGIPADPESKPIDGGEAPAVHGLQLPVAACFSHELDGAVTVQAMSLDKALQLLQLRSRRVAACMFQACDGCIAVKHRRDVELLEPALGQRHRSRRWRNRENPLCGVLPDWNRYHALRRGNAKPVA